MFIVVSTETPADVLTVNEEKNNTVLLIYARAGPINDRSCTRSYYGRACARFFVNLMI